MARRRALTCGIAGPARSLDGEGDHDAVHDDKGDGNTCGRSEGSEAQGSFGSRGALGAAGGAAFVGILVAGRYVALADTGGPSGTPGGKSVDSIGFAGTLRQDGKGMPAGTALTFAFKRQKDGAVGDCPPIEVKVDPDAETGAFSTAIPLNDCAAALFDGGDVFFDVAAGGTLVASGQQALAVPYAKYADNVGTPDCPAGYSRVADVNFVICARGPAGQEDEVVRVGSGASAFWIDRYEAVLLNTAGERIDDPWLSEEFPRHGRWLGTSPPAHAESRRGVVPTTYITWFQANEACRASGKRLPTDAEWQAAARATPDPGNNDGKALGRCNTSNNEARPTGIDNPMINVSCVSGWGAEDMIGNAWEFTTNWSIGVGTNELSLANQEAWPDAGVPGDPDGYEDDRTWNVSSKAVIESFPNVSDRMGAPSASFRGGSWENNSWGGVFAISVDTAPSSWWRSIGFRCIIPR